MYLQCHSAAVISSIYIANTSFEGLPPSQSNEMHFSIFILLLIFPHPIPDTVGLCIFLRSFLFLLGIFILFFFTAVCSALILYSTIMGDNISVSLYCAFVVIPGPMEELHSLDPRRQELLEARFTGAVSGNTGGSTGSMSGGAKVTQYRRRDK